MEPSPTLPPGVEALARSMGLGQLADQAQAVLSQLPAATDPTYQLTDIDQLRDELRQLRADLAPLVGIAQQLAPLLALPKVQRAIAKQQG